jgi:hypothetical protein
MNYYTFEVDDKLYRIEKDCMTLFENSKLYEMVLNNMDKTNPHKYIVLLCDPRVFNIICNYIRGYPVMKDLSFLSNEYLVRSVYSDATKFGLDQLADEIKPIIEYNDRNRGKNVLDFINSYCAAIDQTFPQLKNTKYYKIYEIFKEFFMSKDPKIVEALDRCFKKWFYDIKNGDLTLLSLFGSYLVTEIMKQHSTNNIYNDAKPSFYHNNQTHLYSENCEYADNEINNETNNNETNNNETNNNETNNNETNNETNNNETNNNETNNNTNKFVLSDEMLRELYDSVNYEKNIKENVVDFAKAADGFFTSFR